MVQRVSENGFEVIICGRDSDGVWGLPKGTPDAGESLEQTALREVSEETGLDVRILGKVGVVQYWFTADGVRYNKRVHHYLMEAVGGDIGVHDEEYDRVEWRLADDAMKTLTFKNDRDMVARAREMVEAS